MMLRRLTLLVPAIAAFLCLASVGFATGSQHGLKKPPPPAAVETDRSCGVGTLAFDTAVEIAPPVHPPRAAHVFVNLLDEDDNVDVGFARGRKLFSALGDGQGGFDLLTPISFRPPSYLTSNARRARAAFVDADSGDLDGDGLNDAVLVDALLKRAVRTVQGESSGRLAGRRRAVFLGGGKGPRATTAGDWNGDGLADIATANHPSKSISVLVRDEDGRASSEQVKLPFHPVELISVDVDGDTAIDLLASSAKGNIAILFNREGRFGDDILRVTMHHALWSPGGAIDAADLNRDGRVDLVSLRADGRLSVRLAAAPGFSPDNGNGNGNGIAFGNPIHMRLVCKGRGCRFAGLALGDIDLDGITDLVAASPRAKHDIQLWFGLGDGHFEKGASLRTPQAKGADLRLADVNNDGRLDPVVGAQHGAVFALPSLCQCRAPFEGPICEACNGPACPIGGDPLAMQLTVGPGAIVPLGAALVAASLDPPTDLPLAVETAQSLAALALESDVVVVAQPIGDRNQVMTVGGSAVPFTITTFVVEEVVKGAQRAELEIAQEGGRLENGLRVESSNRFPFPTAGDLALCTGASATAGTATLGTGPFWLLFLRAGSAGVSLVGDLTTPARKVLPVADGFVFRDPDSGLALPIGSLAGLSGRAAQ